LHDPKEGNEGVGSEETREKPRRNWNPKNTTPPQKLHKQKTTSRGGGGGKSIGKWHGSRGRKVSRTPAPNKQVHHKNLKFEKDRKH